MQSLPVVEGLDVFKDLCPHFGIRGIANAMNAHSLKAVEPALRRRIVPAVPLAAH